MEEESKEKIYNPERRSIRCGYLLVAVLFSILALFVLYVQARMMNMGFDMLLQRTGLSIRVKTPIPNSPHHQSNYRKTEQKEIEGWKKNVSRNITDYIDLLNDTTIISGRGICEAPDTKLIIIVPTSPSSFANRMVIRETWASHGISEVKVGFIVGLTNNESMQTLIEQENEQYHDIIQEYFVDTYINLTLKSVALLKWYIQNCQNTSFLMKVDDDTYLDVGMLVSQLAGYGQSGLLLGQLCHRCVPIRDPASKWYSPTYMFSLGKFYPDYLFGKAYMMSMDVAFSLFNASLVSPIFHLEDVYITGICATEAGVNRIALPRAFGNESDVDNCLRNNEKCQNCTVYHSVNSTSMRLLWEMKKNRQSITLRESWKLETAGDHNWYNHN